MRNARSAVVIGLGVWLAAPVELASACSGPVCLPDQFVPHAGSLPANAAGVVWLPGFRYGLDADAGDDGYRETQQHELRFVCTKPTGALRDVPFHVDDYPENCGRGVCSLRFLIVPDDGFVAGETCEIVPTFATCDTGWFGDNPPAYLSGSAHFSVTAEAAFPDSLGGISAHAPFNTTILLGSGSGCDGPNAACVMDIQAALGTAEPWRDALLFHTWVNGERWQPRSHYWLPMPTGGSWQGRGNDRLFRTSPDWFIEDHGLAETNANVLITAELPGLGAPLQTAPIAVTLDCANSNADAGDDRDAGALLDGGISIDAGRTDPGDGNDYEDSGCSCSVAGPRTTHSFVWLWSLAVIGLLAVWRVKSSRAASRGSRARG